MEIDVEAKYRLLDMWCEKHQFPIIEERSWTVGFSDIGTTEEHTEKLCVICREERDYGYRPRSKI